MLPAPSLTSTIPSTHDDTVLDCRIYVPTEVVVGLRERRAGWRKKAAVVAHPYAPMGGCYDDPVVGVIASELLRDGFFVGTFNFRGAGGSKGRTSWTGKPETDDYTSFVGLMVYFMHYLSLPKSSSDHDYSWEDEESYTLTPIPSHALPPPQSPISQKGHKFATVPPRNTTEIPDRDSNYPKESKPLPALLLLAGYSYGSMITERLPSLSIIISLFSAPKLGTAASEIRLRAEQLAKQQNDAFASMKAASRGRDGNPNNTSASKRRRGRSFQPDENLDFRKTSAASTIRMGGEETDPDVRRPSHDSPSRRSFSFEPDRLRRSVDRVRSLGRTARDRSPAKHLSGQSFSPSKRTSSNHGSSSSEDMDLINELGSKSGQSAQIQMDPVAFKDLKVSYLLISPLRDLLTKLATMWTFNPRHKSTDSSLKGHNSTDFEAEHKLIVNDTLAIFGDEDVFSTSKSLRSWACRLQGEDGSCFSATEIAGAGHFWHEEGVVEEMRRDIARFISQL